MSDDQYQGRPGRPISDSDTEQLIRDAATAAGALGADLSAAAVRESSRRAIRRLSVVGPAVAVVAIAALIAVLVVLGGRSARPGTTPKPVGREPHGLVSLGAHISGMRVDCPSANECYAVGQTPGLDSPAAEFLHSSNGGRSWSVVSSSPAGPSVPSGCSARHDCTATPAEGYLSGLSCPATGTCLVSVTAGDTPDFRVYLTRDGGHTWTSLPVPTLVGAKPVLSCASTASCLVAGDFESNDRLRAYVTTNGWKSVTASVLAGAETGWGADCVAPGRCYLATGADGTNPQGRLWLTTDAGAHWVSVGAPASASQMDVVSCSSRTSCVAVGQTAGQVPVGERITGGDHVAPISLGSAHAPFESLACPSAADCVAVAGLNTSGSVLGSVDGGRTWQTLHTSESTQAGTVSCPSTSLCVFGEGAQYLLQRIASTQSFGRVLVSHTLGRTLTSEPLPAGAMPETLACGASSRCVSIEATNVAAVSSDTTSNGSSWSAHAARGFTWLGQPSCPRPSRCYDIGTTSLAATVFAESENGGASWSTRYTFEAGETALVDSSSVDCPTERRCYALVAEGLTTELEVSADAGATWRTANVSAITSGTASLACPQPETCVLVTTSSILTTSDGGLRFSASSVPPSAGLDLWHLTIPLSCSGRTCVTAGDDVSSVTPLVSENDGRTWHAASQLDVAPYLALVSCGTPTSCTFVDSSPSGGAAAYGSTDAGSSWSAEPLTTRIGPTGVITGLACRPSSCLAVGYESDGAGFRLALADTSP